MDKKEISLDLIFKNAVDFHSKGKIKEAKNLYEKVLTYKSDHFLALGNLGIIFSQLKEFDKAIDLFNRAIKLNPLYAEGFNNLGNVLFETHQFEKSLDCYKKAIELNPNFSDAYNNIGNIYQQKENLSKSIEYYELAASFATGLGKAKPYYNLANIFREQGDFEKSIDLYKKAIDINPNFTEAYINLSISLNKTGSLKEAIDNCKAAIKLDPKSTLALNNLGEYNQEIGNEDLSISYYNKAIECDPKNLRSKWLLMNTMPIIYKDFEKINYFNEHFEKRLSELEKLFDNDINLEKKQILNALNSSTNFYLHYQGKDITGLQKRYGSLVTRLTKHIYPQFHKSIPITKPLKFINIGFVSTFFCDHVVSKLFKNWIIKLNRSRFKTFVYHTGIEKDAVTELIKKNSNTFFHSTKTDNVINKIVSDKLDILIFLDIGMEPKMQIIGSLKLAKIQCCTWGVPVTTGFKNIDYFFSGINMETKNSDDHYSEKLIKLPNCSVDYDNPADKYVEFLNFKKEKNKFIFLCLQSNFKLLPHHDHLYFDILKKNSQCKFFFIGTKNEFIATKFKERISKICDEKNINLNNYFVFYPQMPFKNYLKLIVEADVILDSLDWSGFNTSLDAISFDKPVITLPSNFMRGRHSYGILKTLKIDELICSSKKEYVNLAAKLSVDSNYYGKIVNKIKINKNLIFNDSSTTKFLENFFESLF